SVGRTAAAKEITVIPEQTIKKVNKSARDVLKELVFDKCAKEFAQVALNEKVDGLKDAASDLALKLAADEFKGKFDNIFPDSMDKGTENVLKAVEVIPGFFKKRQ
ncbi:MAG: hypothetical protein LUC43_08620, partial [Burkholderiales bacterium]|nr:hypothetical protein [Burkholderiales bacterium]